MDKTSQEFEFIDPGQLSDGELSLVVADMSQADLSRGYVPAYRFDVMIDGIGEPVGYLNFRVVNTPWIVDYAGNIGYGIDEAYRGRGYAARGCKLILPLAKQLGFAELWISASVDNVASNRVCEKLGATLVSQNIPMPPGNEMYEMGYRFINRYRLRVEEE